MGDARADFEEIVNREGKKVYNLACKLCGNREEAKDIAQETFLKTYENFHRFREKSQVFTYLYRIAFNIWKNRLRSRSRRPLFSFHSNDPDQELYDPPDPAPSPAQVLETEEKRALVRSCMESALEPNERFIIILRDMEERSYEEIAEVLGCRLGTVKSRLARARETLRQALIPHMEKLLT